MLEKVKERHELIGQLPDNELSHMLRVGILVETLSVKLTGVDCGKAKLLGESAFYHDVGKIYIPQQILLKKEKLTVTEMNLIRMHSVHGQVVLNQINLDGSFTNERLRLATEAALYHHERWDGSGYPFGFKTKQIPFIGRLTSICDAYDAITSVRPYRRKEKHEQACEELERCSGIQFDPELVNAFLHYSSALKTCVAEPNTGARIP